MEIQVFEPAGRIGVLGEGLKREQVVYGPGIKDIHAEVEIAVFVQIPVPFDDLFSFFAAFAGALRKVCNVLGIIGDRLKVPAALIGAANIIAKAEDTVIEVVALLCVFIIAHMQMGVITDRVVERAEIFEISEDCDADEVLSISDLDHGL